MDCITRVREPSSNSTRNQSIHDTCAGEIALQMMLTSVSGYGNGVPFSETGNGLSCLGCEQKGRGRGFKERKIEQ